jgi:hypothetical protein
MEEKLQMILGLDLSLLLSLFGWTRAQRVRALELDKQPSMVVDG